MAQVASQVSGQAHLGDDSLGDRGFDRGDLKTVPHKVFVLALVPHIASLTLTPGYSEKWARDLRIVLSERKRQDHFAELHLLQASS